LEIDDRLKITQFPNHNWTVTAARKYSQISILTRVIVSLNFQKKLIPKTKFILIFLSVLNSFSPLFAAIVRSQNIPQKTKP